MMMKLIKYWFGGASRLKLSDDLQLRIFGYIDPMPPPPGSIKAKIYEIAEGMNDGQIERLAQIVRRMHESVERHYGLTASSNMRAFGLSVEDARQAMAVFGQASRHPSGSCSISGEPDCSQ